MNEAEKLIKGSVHKDDFFIVHDALVLMSEKVNNQLDETEGVLT